MRQFYLTHKDVQTASGQLSWSHYCELHAISDEKSVASMKRNAKTPILKREFFYLILNKQLVFFGQLSVFVKYGFHLVFAEIKGELFFVYLDVGANLLFCVI